MVCHTQVLALLSSYTSFFFFYASFFLHIIIIPFSYPNFISIAFEKAGVDLSKPSVVMCGGAVVAPFIAFAAFFAGHELPVYDVSVLVRVLL